MIYYICNAMANKIVNRTIEWKTESVNTETGEVVETKKSVNIKHNTADFYMTFIEAIGYIVGITNGNELQVLSILCSHAEYNKGICYLSSGRRKEFCIELNMNPNTFNVCLSRLTKRGIIKNINGDIEINPVCFWKGSIDERNKLLKAQGLELNIKFNSND